MSEVTVRSEAALREALVVANRVLVQHGVVDAFGHVSVRDPRNPARFYMARRVPPQLVTHADIRVFGLDGELVERTGEASFLERFIHSAIYAARPDVAGVVHSHSHHAILFSVSDQPLRAICHTCGFIGAHVPIFEMRNCAKPSLDLLIRNPALGDALAGVLGAENLVLMRGHGSTAVGSTLEQAVYRAVYAEENARLQAAAMRMGKVTFLDDAEIAHMRANETANLERAWDLWRVQFSSPTQPQ